MSNKDKKKPFLSIFEEVSQEFTNGHDHNGHTFPGLQDEEDYLTDELDHEILMHRDAHFGGDFRVMLEYYGAENIGVQPEIDHERITYLAEVEKEMGEDLAPLLLTGSEAEVVASARRKYEALKEIYEQDEERDESPLPRLIADLILTESEDPQEEIQAVVNLGARIVPELLQLIKSDDMYNPLFPGYGLAPYLAITCLGLIRDPSAIRPLFETLGREMLFEEEVILDALHEIGTPAKEFLLKVIKGRPFTQDTINAAFALTVFADAPEVAIACFEELQDPKVQEQLLLRSYLLFNCTSLRNTPHREAFAKMASNPQIPADFRKEIENILREWDSSSP